VSVEVDAENLEESWAVAVGLARRHGISVHGASCLELALRCDLPIATFDTALTRAAAREGVEVVDGS
jgi:hypothetical protein